MSNKTVHIDDKGFQYTDAISHETIRYEFVDALRHVPKELLVEELRKRELKLPLQAVLDINSNGVIFTIDKLNWPTGKYNVNITFKEENTEGK